MNYIHSRPPLISFEGKGYFGYTFGPLQQKDLEIYYIDVKTGYDTFLISKRIIRTYYVLCGTGYFTIANRAYNVSPGMLVEVPPKVEYSYSGQMKLLCISKPRFLNGNNTYTKWNPNVVQGDFPDITDSGSRFTRLVRLSIFGKSPINAYLRLNEWLWNHLPVHLFSLAPLRSYGNLLRRVARIQGFCARDANTRFFRNRPQLELIKRLVERSAKTDTLRIAVLGCGTGAEAYSVALKIRSVRPDLKLLLKAVDISRRKVEVGKCGTYSLVASQFERVTETEMKELFDRDGDVVKIKSWAKEGIEWQVGDVTDLETLSSLGSQDIVVAHNCLSHLYPSIAERCLRNIARVVRPHGYLFVSGIDLEIRSKVANDLGWSPLQELMEEIHEGDPFTKTFWPWLYGWWEPLDRSRRDWQHRYAAAFQLVPFDQSAQNRGKRASHF